jgi:multidrug efflux pump subunit AcrA (membrane-fusion protein)
VYVISPDAKTARRRRVLVGALDGSRVAILGGLAPEDKVVTAGAAWLTDGAKVTVVSSASRKDR